MSKVKRKKTASIKEKRVDRREWRKKAREKGKRGARREMGEET